MLATLSLPLSALELREAVRHARRFDPARLDRVLRVDAEQAQAEVQASTAWTALAGRAAAGPRFAQAWESVAPTIGEALAQNAAGPDGRPFVRHVCGLALVTPDGDLKRVSRTSHQQLFSLAVGGHGVFGAPYSITVDLASLAQAAAATTPRVDLADAEKTTGRPLRLLVPPERVEAFVAACREACAAWRTELGAASVRPVLAESETVLRWARRAYAEVSLGLREGGTLGACVRASQLRRELIELALQAGGSFPIASTPDASRKQVEACYPELKTFFAEKRRLDPAERISNAWYRHHRDLLARELCPVRWAR